ncbi:hypothetical protein ACI3PL_21485, partial [Lacticaseibacillus paracasei]
GQYINFIQPYLDKKENIFIPTNSKVFGDKLLAYLNEKGIKVALACDTTDIRLDDWSKYQVFISTPTNVAGISFNNIHFDHCIPYATNISCS